MKNKLQTRYCFRYKISHIFREENACAYRLDNSSFFVVDYNTWQNLFLIYAFESIMREMLGISNYPFF